MNALPARHSPVDDLAFHFHSIALGERETPPPAVVETPQSSSSESESDRESVTPVSSSGSESDRETPPSPPSFGFGLPVSPVPQTVPSWDISLLPTKKLKNESQPGSSLRSYTPRSVSTPRIASPSSATRSNSPFITKLLNSEEVSVLLKKRNYVFSSRLNMQDYALCRAAPTIDSLRIEAYEMPSAAADVVLNVHDIDAGIYPDSDDVIGMIETGELCARFPVEKIQNLAKIFTNVKTLKIYFAKLQDVHFAALTAFKNLEDLDLVYCKISEPKGFAQLKSLTRLNEVHMTYCYKTTSATTKCFDDFCEHLDWKKQLNGNGQAVSNLLREAYYFMDSIRPNAMKAVLEVAPTIQSLSLDGQFLHVLREGEDPIDVRKLDAGAFTSELIDLIQQNKLPGKLHPKVIHTLTKTFTNVVEVQLSYAVIELDHLRALNHFSNLQTLELFGCKFRDPEVLKYVEKMPALRKLNLLYCEGIGDDALSYLSRAMKLESLKVVTILEQISDEGVQYLLNLSQLEVLEIPHSLVTDDTLFYMTQVLKKLKLLSLRDCPNITERGVRALRDLPDLQYDVHGCSSLPLPRIDWMSLGFAPVPADDSLRYFSEEELEEFKKFAAMAVKKTSDVAGKKPVGKETTERKS
jgi:hypothetical protein